MTAHSISTARCLVVALIGLVLCVSAAGQTMADEPPSPPPRPPDLAAPEKARPPPQAPNEGPASACLTKLIAAGASAEAASAPATSVEGCGIDAPVRLSSITVAGGDVVNLPDRPLLACEFAVVLADYLRLVVAPLGQAMLRAKVVAIETGPGYECRTQDRIAGAKISAHAKGLAVDFAAIALADKRRVLIERQTSVEEASFVHVVRTAACGWFTTVLGPGADAFHAANIHLDIEQHGRSDNYRICQ